MKDKMKDKRLVQMIFGIFLGGFIYILILNWLAPLILGTELYRIFWDAQYHGYPPSLDTLFDMIRQAFVVCSVLGVGYLAWVYPFQDKEINNVAQIMLFKILLIPIIISIVLLTIFHIFEFDIGRTAAAGVLVGGMLISLAINWNTVKGY